MHLILHYRTSRTSFPPKTLPNLITLHQDWKTHKPFCRPDAPCSIIDTGDVPVLGGTSKHGAISIPITGPDGETRIISSSTMSAQMLKEIKEYAEARGGGSSVGGGASGLDGHWHIEGGELEF
jgi:hypothetical protein